MATIVPTVTTPAKRRIRAVWAGMASGDVGAPVDFARYADKTCQVDITTAGDGSLEMQGSNDGTNYAAMKEPDGTAITGVTTDNDIFSLLENPRDIRPSIAGSTGSGWTVTLEAVASG